MDNISDIIGIIGFFTGAVSFAVPLREHRFTFGKLVISLANLNNIGAHSFYFKTSKAYDGLKPAEKEKILIYDTKYAAAISLRIVNKSNYPVSIDDVYLSNNSGRKAHHYNNFSFNYLHQISETDKNYSYAYAFADTGKLPIVLQPFEIKYVGIRIPFLEPLVDNFGGYLNLKLIVENSRKTETIDICLEEFDTYHKRANKF